MDELIGNLTIYELNKIQDKDIRTKKKDKTLTLKSTETIDYEEKNLAL